MGWQDRDYNRDGSARGGNPLWWLVTGSVPLLTAFGIRVRMHASMIIFIVLMLLFGPGRGYAPVDRLVGAFALFVIVLLHEFGHCFAARWMGGSADEIVMHPLGGLALTSPPHRPWPMLVTTAGGPLVNVAICLILAPVIYLLSGGLPWQPFYYDAWTGLLRGGEATRYLYWFYQMSWTLLLFNLLPIFPLDGGRLLQEGLWFKFGYYRSMMFATMTGMIGAVAAAAYAFVFGALGLILLAVLGFMHCYQMRAQLKAAGPWAFENETDYGLGLKESYSVDGPKISQRAARKAQQKVEAQRAAERAEQAEIDVILDKVSKQGMNSLSRGERKALARATENQRKRNMPSSRR